MMSQNELPYPPNKELHAKFNAWFLLVEAENKIRLENIVCDVFSVPDVAESFSKDGKSLLNESNVDPLNNSVYQLAAVMLAKKRLEDVRTQGIRSIMEGLLSDTNHPINQYEREETESKLGAAPNYLATIASGHIERLELAISQAIQNIIGNDKENLAQLMAGEIKKIVSNQIFSGISSTKR